MGLHPDFPADPYTIVDPTIRWYPGEAMLDELGYEMLLPPLVHKVRRGVKAWRDKGYDGASATTRALLNHWFNGEHPLPQANGSGGPFRWYFAQRSRRVGHLALRSGTRARPLCAEIDSSGRVSKGMFDEDWPRYVMKLATGAGKTKVMSLLIAWCYFHKRYENGSDLSNNFLLIAPNIIVLDRLRVDFDGLKIFHQDPVLPANGYQGQNWQDDFQVTIHVQDQIGLISDTGNIFLTNIHRVFKGDDAPSFDDADTADYFLGPRPSGKSTDSQVDLGLIIREVPDLVVLNDEAHHIHDRDMAWFRNIQDISNQLRRENSKLSVQFDLTTTPRHNKGGIFVQTISDYPLVEAIRQQVVKTPVLPDGASRAKLEERQSAKFTERYEDYLHLGYLEWKKAYEELLPTGKKSVMFIMTDDTRNCDEVRDYLEARYNDLKGAVLVIHTKNNGEISEANSSAKSKEELDQLRKESRQIDDPANSCKVIVSVMMLREGWDVQNVVTIVGLRPYTAESKILPEQTLGRGLRRMFRGEPVPEKVSVIGTDAFIEFVEGIKAEGVDLEYEAMGAGTRPKCPIVVEVDTENADKDIGRLDIELPVLAPRIYREYKNLNDLDVAVLPHKKLPVKQFSEEEQREIVFRNIDTELESHKTVMESIFEPNSQNVIGYFTRTIMRDLRLVGGFDVLFGKVKQFVQDYLFDRPVDLDDRNILRNLSEIEATRTLSETLKAGVNALTIQDKGMTEIRSTIKMSAVRPYIVKDQAYLQPKKSVFNRVVGDSEFELEFAAFLDSCDDIISFVKNTQSTLFRIEYRNVAGVIAHYIPDFIVKRTDAEIWIVETKGREDLTDVAKWERLQQWCADASAHDAAGSFHPLFLRQEDWDSHPARTFSQLIAAFASL